MELKGRRELFCREYLKDLHGTNSALRAGFPESDARTYASKLLAEQEITDRIAELAQARNQKLEISAEVVLIELLRMLTSDAALAYNEHDGTLKALHDIPIDLRRCIASVKTQETFEGSGKEREWTGYIKEVKFWSKEKAAELLGRHLALFKDQLNLTGLEDLAAKIEAARSRERDALSLV
jgi:phage terminase small subunit